jgi:hypothetical protein
MHGFRFGWFSVVIIVALGIAVRVLFVWSSRTTRGVTIEIVLSIVLGLLAILIGSGYIKL